MTEDELNQLMDAMFYWQGQSENITYAYGDDEPCWLVGICAPFGVMVDRLYFKRPDTSDLWEVVKEAMKMPQVGDYRRPTRFKARANEGWEALEPELREAGIELEICDELDLVDGWIEAEEWAFAEWDRRRIKWKVLTRDNQGNVVVVESALTRSDAELSVLLHNPNDGSETHWIEREDESDTSEPNLLDESQ